MPDGGVHRAWKDGAAKVPGFLDDYACLANALLDLYESCFEKRYLDRAVQLVELILEKFWEDGLYFTPRDGEKLVHRPRAPHDNAWPSGTSTSVFAFLRLHELTGRDRYRDRAEHVFRMYGAAAAKNPFSFAHLWPQGTSHSEARSTSSSPARSSGPPRWWRACTARISPLVFWPLLRMFRSVRAGTRSMANLLPTCAGIAVAMHR